MIEVLKMARYDYIVDAIDTFGAEDIPDLS